MSSIDTINPGGPALPDTPPITTRELAVGLVGLFGKADGLVQPRYITVYGPPSQRFSLSFLRSADSIQAVEGWAHRFGAVLASDDYTDEDGKPFKHVHATFDFFGVEVEAYAFIPVTQTGT
jgi:hypothetical protein